MILEPGNIWSGSKTLAAFTNPTELAFRKGNVNKHYPIKFLEVTYDDAEEAYQLNKNQYKNNKINLMYFIVYCKLDQYPILVKIIKKSGGIEFLEKCEHIVYNNSDWEGKGRDSAFIRCLIAAYRSIIEKK